MSLFGFSAQRRTMRQNLADGDFLQVERALRSRTWARNPSILDGIVDLAIKILRLEPPPRAPQFRRKPVLRPDSSRVHPETPPRRFQDRRAQLCILFPARSADGGPLRQRNRRTLLEELAPGPPLSPPPQRNMEITEYVSKAFQDHAILRTFRETATVRRTGMRAGAPCGSATSSGTRPRR